MISLLRFPAIVVLIIFSATACTLSANSSSGERDTVVVTVAPKEAEASHNEEGIPPKVATYPLGSWSWPQGAKCSPPCWQGILPGETKLEAAYGILTLQPDVSGLKILEPIFQESGSLSWQSSFYSQGDAIALKDNDTTINYIIVRLRKQVCYSVVEIEYGDPDYVQLWTDEEVGQYEMTFIYTTLGFAFTGSVKPLGEEKEFQAFCGNMLEFFSPNSLNGYLAVSFMSERPGNLVEWKIGETLRYYCEQASTSNGSVRLRYCPNHR